MPFCCLKIAAKNNDPAAPGISPRRPEFIIQTASQRRTKDNPDSGNRTDINYYFPGNSERRKAAGQKFMSITKYNTYMLYDPAYIRAPHQRWYGISMILLGII